MKPNPDFSDWPEYVLSPKEAAKFELVTDAVSGCGVQPFSLQGSIIRDAVDRYLEISGCHSWYRATREQREAAWDYVITLLGYTEDC